MDIKDPQIELELGAEQSRQLNEWLSYCGSTHLLPVTTLRKEGRSQGGKEERKGEFKLIKGERASLLRDTVVQKKGDGFCSQTDLSVHLCPTAAAGISQRAFLSCTSSLKQEL